MVILDQLMEEKHAMLAMVSVSLKNVEAKNGIQNVVANQNPVVNMTMVGLVGIMVISAMEIIT